MGPPGHRASGQSDRNISFALPPAPLQLGALLGFFFVCANKHLFFCICDVFLDSGHQPDGDIREGTLYSGPRGEEDGAVLNKCVHLVLPQVSMPRCSVGGAVVAMSTMAA